MKWFKGSCRRAHRANVLIYAMESESLPKCRDCAKRIRTDSADNNLQIAGRLLI
jgi:hypothetical protein